MVGLGRMGANMARRLLRAGHRVVAYDRDLRDAPAVRRPRGGASGARGVTR
ncbi:MAG TPA: NAD(P)-binding domain-containing protein [Anaeromyxobacter sp.]|nr:NAD(P)-binding domain-containing protein [Anaeromyxobacter sp.]